MGARGPPGAQGGDAGGVNTVAIIRNGQTHVPLHLSKDQDIHIREGDLICVSTPGGGGYGAPADRDPAAVRQDLARGYYTVEQVREAFG